MFKFRLQRLLDIREQKEREAALALSRAEQERESAQAALAAVQAARQAGRERLVAAHASSGTVGQLHNIAFLLEQLDRQVVAASRTVAEAEAVTQRTRQALNEAHVERRVLDRLRERHESDWRGAAAHADRVLMDDIALSRHVQRNTPTSSVTNVAGEG